MEAAKRGSIQAFDELVRRNQSQILKIAKAIMRRQDEAQDIVQEAFIKAFTHLQQFRGESSFRIWVVRIAINEVLMRARRKAVTSISLDESLDPTGKWTAVERAACDPNPEALCQQEELAEILVESIARLNPRYRFAFVFCDVLGFRTREAAQLAGVSISAIKSRLIRSRLQLRGLISPYFKRERTLLYFGNSRGPEKRTHCRYEGIF